MTVRGASWQRWILFGVCACACLIWLGVELHRFVILQSHQAAIAVGSAANAALQAKQCGDFDKETTRLLDEMIASGLQHGFSDDAESNTILISEHEDAMSEAAPSLFFSWYYGQS